MFDYKGERMPIPTQDTLAKKSESVPTTRTINGQTLDEDVTLTGADIAYNDSTTISAKISSVD